MGGKREGLGLRWGLLLHCTLTEGVAAGLAQRGHDCNKPSFLTLLYSLSSKQDGLEQGTLPIRLILGSRGPAGGL